MLERLDSIDWSSLTDAYGSARDVPIRLRALLSEDAGVRSEALDELFGSVWHQGTIYPVSAHVVPFLMELLAAREVQDKTMLVILLASIAGGRGYYEVHEPLSRTLPGWRAPADLEEQKRQETKAVAAVRRAVSPIVPYLLPYLGDAEPEVRRSVAEALPCYPEHRAVSEAALQAARAKEAEEEVASCLDEALATLGKNS